MEHWNLDDIGGDAADGARYSEFLRHESMSAGVYEIPAGAPDPQSPHGEDEAYLVLRGRGTITVDDEEQSVGPGSLVFVPRRATHRFHDVTEDLRILVFFAPAETDGVEESAE
jgi:mannose-6-phosphate isomerase-like protein (cupin superfamily)